MRRSGPVEKHYQIIAHMCMYRFVRLHCCSEMLLQLIGWRYGDLGHWEQGELGSVASCTARLTLSRICSRVLQALFDGDYVYGHMQLMTRPCTFREVLQSSVCMHNAFETPYQVGPFARHLPYVGVRVRVAGKRHVNSRLRESLPLLSFSTDRCQSL
jgi:hypothetical protein